MCILSFILCWWWVASSDDFRSVIRSRNKIRIYEPNINTDACERAYTSDTFNAPTTVQNAMFCNLFCRNVSYVHSCRAAI